VQPQFVLRGERSLEGGRETRGPVHPGHQARRPRSILGLVAVLEQATARSVPSPPAACRQGPSARVSVHLDGSLTDSRAQTSGPYSAGFWRLTDGHATEVGTQSAAREEPIKRKPRAKKR
jgi:hypothetical protein